MKDEGEMRVTTTLPMSIWREAKLRGIPIRALILRGWQSEEAFPKLLERINEAEDKMRRYQFELEAVSRKLHEKQGGLR